MTTLSARCSTKASPIFQFGDELRRVQETYLGVLPDGRDRLHWKGLIHVRVKPLWIRYSNYEPQPPLVLEFDAAALRVL